MYAHGPPPNNSEYALSLLSKDQEQYLTLPFEKILHKDIGEGFHSDFTCLDSAPSSLLLGESHLSTDRKRCQCLLRYACDTTHTSAVAHKKKRSQKCRKKWQNKLE